MALCREYSSESLHQSLMEEGLVEGHSFVFIKYSPTFSTDYLYKMFMIGLMNRFDKPNKHCWRRQWHSTPVLLPGESHRWRSLVGCSPWGRAELDTTERLHFHFHALEKEMATHSSVLAWRIPGTGKPGWAAVCGVSQSRTRLKQLSSS